MASELVFNGILLLFTIYCFVIIGDLPDGTSTDTLTASMYPRIIIGLLIVLFVSNMINIYKNKKEGETFKIDFSIEKIVKNKMFIGSVLLLIYTFALDYTGFIISSLVFFGAYSYLLGERRVKILVLSSLVSVVAIYVLFDGLLGIMLPRGTGVFRNFALFVESLI